MWGCDGRLSDELYEFLKGIPRQAPLLADDADIFVSLEKGKTAEDLDRLLLARDLVRQTLVYARYHARMREGEGMGS